MTSSRKLSLVFSATLLLFAAGFCLASDFSTTQAWFTNPPVNDTLARDTLIEFIDSAQTTLDVAIYRLTYGISEGELTDIADALLRARQRGVQLRCVTDVSSESGTQFDIWDTLSNNGTPTGEIDRSVVRSGNNSGLMHNKFIIADQNRVLTGSANFTEAAFFNQENNIIVVPGEGIAAAYKAEFDQMWAGIFGNANQPKPNRYYTTDDGIPVEVFFGADDNLTAGIVSAINTATERVYFLANYFSRGNRPVQIANALIAAADRGVDVRGVFDSASNDTEQWETFTTHPATDVVDYIGPLNAMHNKICIVDPGAATAKVLTGSNNWSNAADLSNDENMLVLSSPELSRAYFDHFRISYVERSSNAHSSQILRMFGDLTGDNQITTADYYLARSIAAGQVEPTPLQLITGDVAPVEGVNGHLFGDGVIDFQDVAWIADYLGISPDALPVSTILQMRDGNKVNTDPLIVSASFGTTFYVQQPDRSSGIRVQGAQVQPGTEVSVSGFLSTLLSPNGERYIAASPDSVVVHSTGNPLPEPLRISLSSLGGSGFGPFTNGITGASGLYNIGLRVISWGRVTGYGPLSFWIDDGSSITDPSGNRGVKVSSGSLQRPPLNSLVLVTGICSMERVSGQNVRLLRPSIQSDIIQISPEP